MNVEQNDLPENGGAPALYTYQQYGKACKHAALPAVLTPTSQRAENVQST